MGLLGKIFGDSDLGCAVGVAISPFGALATGECNATIEKVANKAGEIVQEATRAATSYRDDAFLPENTKDLIGAALAPLPFYVLGRFAGQQLGQQLNKSLGLSPEAGADLQHQLSSIAKILILTATPLLFPGPLLPVAVGLERYIRPIASQVAEEAGSFTADLFSSAAMIGFAGVGKVLSAGVKKAQATVMKERFESYMERISPF